MSSDTKDPLQKQVTSESSDPPSDSDIDEAEDNLGHLKIEEGSTKAKKTDESKPLDSPTQEGTLTSQFDLSNEPIPGPSGLQRPRLESSDDSSETGWKAVDPQQKKLKTKGIQETIRKKMAKGKSLASQKDVEEKCIEEDVGARMEEDVGARMEEDVGARMEEDVGARMEEDSDRSRRSSSGETSRSISQDGTPLEGPSVIHGDIENLRPRYRDIAKRFLRTSPETQTSSSRRRSYATDSANTSADVSEIRSEIVDSSREGSVYHDAPEEFEKEESPSFVSALERQQSSETSDTNISEIQDFPPPPTPESSSVSISTNTGEQGHRAYLAQLQREADARGEPISTSSGIGSTDQSELAHLRNWGFAGEPGFYRHDIDDPNQDLSDNVAEGGEPLPTSESIEGEPIQGDQQDFERLFERERQNVENREEMNVPDDGAGPSAPRSQAERVVQGSNVGAGSPYKRRRPSKCPSDISKSEKEDIGKPRPKYKPDAEKRSKMVASKSRPALQSSSESPEPKSSSSDELHRKESPDIKSASEGQETSKPETSRHPYKTRGELRRMQHPTLLSQESVIVEEDEDVKSPRSEAGPSLMETEDPTSKTVDTTLEGAAEATETSEAKPSTESSDEPLVSETAGTLKEDDQRSEDFESERSVGKSKRGPKLSNSPPSDEKPDSAQKAATSRPKKRARSEKVSGKTRRTRHDSGGSVPKSVNLGNITQSESTSASDVSDYTPSDDEKQTRF